MQNRSIEQWKKNKRPADSHMNGHLLYNTGDKVDLQKKSMNFQLSNMGQLGNHLKKYDIGPCFTQVAKINSI